MKRTLSVGDLDVAYTEVGDASDPRPFVLVHGYSGRRQDFDPVLEELAPLGRILVPDLRGHGETDPAKDPTHYSFDVLVDDLRGFLDGLGIETCDLLGHSMGGMVMLRFALAHPERVASLVCMNTTGRALEGIDEDGFALAWTVARAAGMEKLQKALSARLRNDPERAPSDRRCEEAWGEGYWEHHRLRFHSMDPEAYARLGPAMLEQDALGERLGAIACPTLVLVGAEDRGFLDAARELAREIPDAEHVVLPDAEHHPHRENKPAWLAAIRAHVARARGALSRDRGSAAGASRGSP